MSQSTAILATAILEHGLTERPPAGPGPLPAQLALPLILATSVALWVMVWKLSIWGVLLAQSWLG